MSFPTEIEYCHGTFSPWIGCAKVSPGCNHCFAEAWAKRAGFIQRGKCDWRPGGKRMHTSEANWRQPLKWNARAAERGDRYRILFDLGDPFDGAVPVHWLWNFLDIIKYTPHLDWLLLTKRPAAALQFFESNTYYQTDLFNTWLGCSICTQAEAEDKIPILLSIPARIHWISCEPLLEHIVFPAQYCCSRRAAAACGKHPLDWVVAGCSSATRSQPAKGEWFYSLRNQCLTAGVPFFLKQMVVNGKLTSMPELDGRKWEEYPA